MIEITIDKIDKLIIISLTGNYYREHILEIDSEFKKQLEQSPEIIAVNCENLDHIDSTGVASIVKIYNRCKEKNIKLIFYDANAEVKNIFERTNLSILFEVISREKFQNQYL